MKIFWYKIAHTVRCFQISNTNQNSVPNETLLFLVWETHKVKKIPSKVGEKKKGRNAPI